MRIFERKSKRESPVQTISNYGKNRHPFTALDRYQPLSNTEMSLYETLKEAIPIIDAAICKIIRLIGTFNIECANKNVEHELKEFLDSVKVNSTSIGMGNFIDTFFNQLLTYGTAVGEIVPNVKGNDIAALYNASLKDVELRLGDNPLDLEIYRKGVGGNTLIEFPERILISVMNPIPGKVYGNSILKGLPFVSKILLTIFNSIESNWDRVGNLRFAVTYKPGADSSEKAYAKERAIQIAEQWSKAMNSTDAISDFIAVGDVNIKVIGADNQVIDSEVPVRQILEQIIAKLGIPPFLLGISWSTSERMSVQQVEILTREIESYRKMLNPIINKICQTWMRYTGHYSNFKIDWDNINLKDEVELANIRLIEAKANKLEKESN